MMKSNSKAMSRPSAASNAFTILDYPANETSGQDNFLITRIGQSLLSYAFAVISSAFFQGRESFEGAFTRFHPRSRRAIPAPPPLFTRSSGGVKYLGLFGKDVLWDGLLLKWLK